MGSLRLIRGRAGLLLAPFLLVGCNHVAPVTEPRIGPITTITSVIEMPTMPLAEFLPSNAELHAIQRTYTATLNSCVATSGQGSQVADTPALDAFITLLVTDRKTRSPLYGFFDSTGPEHGYVHTGPAKDGYEATYPPDIPAAQLTRCSEKTEDRMNGLVLTMEGSKLPDGGPTVPLGDSRFVAASRKWSTCMQSAGYSYRMPIDAMTDAKWREEGSTPSAEQKRVATADVKCKLETNLVGVAVAVQRAYEARYVDGHRDQLEKLNYTPSR